MAASHTPQNADVSPLRRADAGPASAATNLRALVHAPGVFCASSAVTYSQAIDGDTRFLRRPSSAAAPFQAASKAAAPLSHWPSAMSMSARCKAA